MRAATLTRASISRFIMAAGIQTGRVHIGISGWRYKGWRGGFYPPRLPQRSELAFAAGLFHSIEINGTHYSLQRPNSFLQWRDETPEDFIFSIKGSRFITHMKKLRDVEEALANFFAQGLLALGPKLGPILWQVAPQFTFDADRLTSFFEQLPRTTDEAARVALEHHPRLVGRAVTEAVTSQPLRHCLEIRNDTCVCPDFVALLRLHNIGLVVADTVEWPLLFDLTSDFVYCRLHGSEELYASGYGDAALDVWAERVVRWTRGQEAEDEPAGSRLHGHHASTEPPKQLAARDVYVYFDNDAKVHAPFDAQHLRERVDRLLQSS